MKARNYAIVSVTILLFVVSLSPWGLVKLFPRHSTTSEVTSTATSTTTTPAPVDLVPPPTFTPTGTVMTNPVVNEIIVTNEVTVTNTVINIVTNEVTITNAVASTAAPTSMATNQVVAMVATPTGIVSFYQDGTVSTTTNPPVGMVDGLPVLIDNVSKKTVSLTLRRVAGRGSITLPEVLNETDVKVFLLQGQYTCTWRIKGRTEVAGSCTMTVAKGDSADMVVGKGVFSATLTLANE